VVNRAPIGVIKEPLEGETFNTDHIVKFDATSSSDPDGDPISIKFESNLDGLLGTDKITESSLSEGEHAITLTVIDSYNATTTKTVNITVIQLRPNLSNIDIVLTPEEPKEGQTVTVKATISNTGDAPANDVEIKFVIDDDTLSEDTISKIEASNTKAITTTFTATAGAHVLKVEIVDGLEKVVNFEVEERIKPTAVAGEDITVNVNEMVSFDGSESSTPGTHLTYLWEFDDDSNKTGEKVQHTYDKTGTYYVTLTVTDELGKKDIDTVTVTVLSSKATTSKDESGMDLAYIGIIVVIIIVIVLIVLFMMLKRKRSGKEGEVSGQVTPQFPQPPVPQQQLSYIPPPSGIGAQAQPDYIPPPQDLVVQQPQVGYIQPPHYETAPQPQMDYLQAPQDVMAQPPQMGYTPQPPLETAPQPQLGYLPAPQEDVPPQPLESPEGYLPQENIPPPSQGNIETPPTQENVAQPTANVSNQSPKIVPKIKQNDQQT
jgi:PKD repeat protein